MPSILVLMSTYNGEKFLREQINSILNQKDVDVSILIGDDCSTDNTKKILDEYSNKYSNIKYFINEKNKNFTYNFIDLIFKCNEILGKFDYYALSDQDDVWLQDKLYRGIESISNYNEPCLYMSNLDAVDERLNYICKKQTNGANGCNKYNYFFENICTGCTAIFNQSFLDRIKLYYPKNIYLHDYWIFLVAAYTSKFVYDNNSYILYRQHGKNLIGIGKKDSFISLIKKCFKKRKKVESTLCSELLKGYEGYISKEDVTIIRMLLSYKRNLFVKFKLMFSKKYKRRTGNFGKKIKLLLNKY